MVPLLLFDDHKEDGGRVQDHFDGLTRSPERFVLHMVAQHEFFGVRVEVDLVN